MRPATQNHIRLSNCSIRILCSVLVEHGIDATLALAAAGLSPAAVAEPDGQVLGSQEAAFQRAFFELTPRRPDLWFQAGLRYRLVSYGVFGLAVMAARSLGRAIEVGTASNDLHYSLLTFAPLQASEGLVGLEANDAAVPADMRTYSVYRALGSLSTLLNDLWQSRFPMLRIELAVEPPHDARYFCEALGVDIVFGCARNRWLWAAELSEQPLPMSNHLLEERYERHCQVMISSCETQDSFTHRALNALVLNLGRYLSAEQLAQSLGISPRTLQRELHRRGVSYRSLLDQVRGRQAQRLLGAGLKLAHVAELLGYSEAAALSRAYKRWTGRPPGASRARASTRPITSSVAAAKVNPLP